MANKIPNVPVVNLNIDILPHDVFNYKKILDNTSIVLFETELAIQIKWNYDEKWIPKSKCRLDTIGNLWVANWFYNKELNT
jgi:hypothetical protein